MKGAEGSVSVMVVFAAVLFGFLGLATRNLMDYGLTTMEISLVRSVVTLVFILVFILVKDRSLLRITKKDIPVFIGLGVMKFLSDVTLFLAQKDTSLAMATLLQMTAPYYVLVFSMFLFKERITAKKAMCVIGAFLGLLMVCDILNGKNSVAVAGAMAGIASGYFSAMYFVGSRVANNRGYRAESVLFWIFLASTVVNVPFVDYGVMADAIVVPDAVMYMLALGILFTAVPYFLLNWAMERISPSTVSVLTVLEAVAAGVVGLVFFGEELSLLRIVGMSVVMLSVVLMNIRISIGIRKHMEKMVAAMGLEKDSD